MVPIRNFSEKASQNWIKEAERVRHSNMLDLKGVVRERGEEIGERGKGDMGFVVFELGERKSLRREQERGGEKSLGEEIVFVSEFSSGSSSDTSFSDCAFSGSSSRFSSHSSSSSSASSQSFGTPYLFPSDIIINIVNQLFDAITYLHNNLHITHNNITTNNTFHILNTLSSFSSPIQVKLGMGHYEKIKEGEREGESERGRERGGKRGDWLALGKLVGEIGGAGGWKEGGGEWVERVNEEDVKELVRGLVEEGWGEGELGGWLNERGIEEQMGKMTLQEQVWKCVVGGGGCMCVVIFFYRVLS